MNIGAQIVSTTVLGFLVQNENTLLESVEGLVVGVYLALPHCNC